MSAEAHFDNQNEYSQRNICATVIQRRFRGVLGRKKAKNLKVFKRRVDIQKRLETNQGQLYFRIERNGAAVIIQRWYRYEIHRCQKKLWQRKHKKFIEWRKRFVILRGALKKTKGYSLTMSSLLEDRSKLREAVAIVLCRVVRGYLDRTRMSKYRALRAAYDSERKHAAIVLQRNFRIFIARMKYPHIGERFMMLRRKRRLWEARSKIALKRSGDLLNDLRNVLESATDDGTFVFLRRNSFHFANMKLGNADFLGQLDSIVLHIQRPYRRMRARLRYQSAVANRTIIYILRIQHWLLTWSWRRKVSKALNLLQPFWRFKAWKSIRRKRAIAVLQSAWRSTLKRYHFSTTVRLKWTSRKVIRTWVAEVKDRRRERKRLLRERARLELIEGGQTTYAATRLRWHAYFLLQGAQKVKTHTAHHEMQKLFSALSLNGMMDSGKLLKYFKECKKILSPDFTANTVELQFARVKEPSEKRIDYKQFVQLLTNLAIIKILRVDSSYQVSNDTTATANDKRTIPSKSSTQPTNSETKPVAQDNDAAVTNYTFAHLTGQSALLIHFIFLYIMPSSEFARVVSALGEKTAEAVSSAHIEEGVRGIHRFFRNKLVVRKLTQDLRDMQKVKRQKKENIAATKIQNGIRRFLGLRLVVRLAQDVYSKYIDGESERPYWYNARTERAFWSKPPLLGRFDCGMATRMPLPDEEFKILCGVCDKVSATCYCLDCKEPQCSPCFAKGHKTGNRLRHRHLPMENCVQCEYQIGTRSCKNCGDVFCDSCYRYIHKKGRLRFHVCQRLCPRCDSCEDYSAQWSESFTELQEDGITLIARTRLWCNVCFKREFGCLPHEYEVSEMRKVDFYGRSYRNYKLKNEEEIRKKQIADAFARRMLELEGMKKVSAAINIQRVFRGYWNRKSIHDFLTKRRHFMQQRRKEESFRNSFYYKLLCWLGFPIPLESDTTLERVMKLYPAYKHHILAAAIEDNWNLACRLLTEHEERLSAHPKANAVQKFLASIRYYFANRQYSIADADFSEKCKLFDEAQKNYLEVHFDIQASMYIFLNNNCC